MGAVLRAPRHLPRSLLVTVAILSLASLGAASAWALSGRLSYQNPLRNPRTGKPFSCADPFAAAVPAYGTGYVLVCTQSKKNALPIYRSRDLVHWYADGFVFPHGHQPWWARQSTGRNSGGRFWAPEIYNIQGRWIVYFSAQYDAAKQHLEVPGAGPLANGTMVLGDAWSTSLSGPWHTALLHYRGQFNGVSAQPESLGAAIDPSVVQDPATGRLYLFWSDQTHQIWAGELSSDGTQLGDQVQMVLHSGQPFECDPRTRGCTVEAPEPFAANGMFYLLYSGGSTWDSSYDVGVAQSPNPLGPYVKLDQPILRQGHGFYSTGHTSHPIVGPDGNTYILYQARTRPGFSLVGSQRYLMLGRVGWAHGWPTIAPG